MSVRRSSVGEVRADRVVVGRRIRSGAARPDVSGPGFVAMRGDRIIAVDTTDGPPDDLIGPRTEVVDAGDGLVVAGLHDNHTFFTSQLLEHGGMDVSALGDDSVLSAARAAAGRGERLVLRGLDAARAGELVERIEPEAGADVVAIADGRETIELTAAARHRLGALDPASNESLHALYAQLASDERSVRAAFSAAAERMYRGGVVSVKDIAFDTHLGMLPTIDGMLADGSLAVRYAFASQAVASRPDLDAADVWRVERGQLTEGGGIPGRDSSDRRDRRAQRERRARFHGFKLMTDGSFDELTADLLPPDDRWRAAQRSDVDYEALAAEAQRVLEAGFRLALNADGDGAARACLDVFESFAAAGRLPAGSSLSDASLVDPVDAARLGRLGLVVETYPQLLRYPGYDRALLGELLGHERGSRLGAFRAMRAAGVRVTAGTDFPLFDPSLPEAMLSASERALRSGGLDERWATQNAVSRAEVLEMWTGAAASAMGEEGDWGALATGAAADVVIYDRDLLAVPAAELIGAEPTLVIASGRVVYAR